MTEPITDKVDGDQSHVGVVVAGDRLRGRVPVWGIVGALTCAFLTIDFFLAWNWDEFLRWDWGVADSDNLLLSMLLSILLGLCIGQVNLIGVWTSLAPGNIVLRFSWSVLLTMATWYALVFGRSLPQRAFDVTITRPEAIVLIYVLLIGVAALQVPLWIAKKGFGWRLTQQPADGDAALQDDRQFRLWHLLGAMALVSLALAPFREFLPRQGSGYLHFDQASILVIEVTILGNLIMTVPCVWLAYAPTRAMIWLLIGWLFYGAVLTTVEFNGLQRALSHDRSLSDAILLYVIHLSQCAAVLAAMLIFRALGFRLVRTPAIQPPSPGDSEQAATLL
jgi:hypothetical protein